MFQNISKKIFQNIGKKIKVLAQINFWILTVGGIVAGIILFSGPGGEIGLLPLLGGPLVAWMLNCFIYGFGELVEKTCRIERKVSFQNKDFPQTAQDAQVERIEKLKDLRAKNLISEEEFKEKYEEIMRTVLTI